MKKFDLVWNWQKFIASGYFDRLPRLKTALSEDVQAGQKENELLIYVSNNSQREWINNNILTKAQEDFSRFCDEGVVLSILIREPDAGKKVSSPGKMRYKSERVNRWKWAAICFFAVPIGCGLIFVIFDLPALKLHPVVKAILETLIAGIGVMVALRLIDLFFQEVLDSSLFICFRKESWRERPLSCAIAILIFALATAFIVSVFFGVLLYGSEPMPNNYDYIRNDEPYRTWP